MENIELLMENIELLMEISITGPSRESEPVCSNTEATIRAVPSLMSGGRAEVSMGIFVLFQRQKKQASDQAFRNQNLARQQLPSSAIGTYSYD